MTKIVILGAGISGHTAALHLTRKLGKSADITVVSPNSQWNWIPSNIWVGVGKMKANQVLFKLAPIYKRMGVRFIQGKAVAIRPHGDKKTDKGLVDVISTSPDFQGKQAQIPYDYLINCTGPKLNFSATPGLGPDEGYTLSVCTAPHATEAYDKLKKIIDAARKGEKKTVVIGTGHGTCTCQGAAFEYTFNVNHELEKARVRDNVDLIYLTNEAALGDFGVDGMTFTQQGYTTTSRVWTESLFRERNVKAIVGTGVTNIEPKTIHYETLDGSKHELDYDFAMLIPPFSGHPIKAFDKQGNDITEQMFAPSGFMKVDGDYTPRPYEEWSADDWPKTYECPHFPNHFAAGIAFAPPHQISRPRKNPNGVMIAPAPPRTGMPSGMIAAAVAKTIANRVKGKDVAAAEAPMTSLGAACVASTGSGLSSGTAAAMTMYPVVPDYNRFPGTGRDAKETRGEIGLSGHWMKLMLHYLFIYKAKAYPFWWLIPE
ncbi:MAG: FAD-dependent oxidoreductase [Actinomycetaceae bacterium]|nr:FAD-dependent oxidoreductase [Actinomycetaceae bacterium]